MSDIIEEEAEVEEEGAPWMATFADLMSLLFTFFVLLLSFANMDVVKFREAIGSLKYAFGYSDHTEGALATRSMNLLDFDEQSKNTDVKQPIQKKYTMQEQPTVKQIIVSKNDELLAKVEESIEFNDIEEMVSAEKTGRGVVVRIKGELLYPAGSHTLKEESHKLLDDIVAIMEQFDYKINIEGHSDNTPISTVQYPSNWELSSARAISALKYILKSGRIPADRLGAAGYADTRPLASNDTAEGRLMNRRVEFIFYEGKEDSF